MPSPSNEPQAGSVIEHFEALTLVRICVVGSVDDGKSTLLGRLLHDLDAIPEDHLEDLRAAHARSGRSHSHFDLAWVTDGLRAERDQGITIDVAYRHLTMAGRRIIFADTPGHEQYTRNMAGGSSTADAAIILADAFAGVTAQTRRHVVLASVFGVKQLVVVLNKMDLVEFNEHAYVAAVAAFQASVPPVGEQWPVFIPASALLGDNVVTRSALTPWYSGPTLSEWLQQVRPDRLVDGPLRFAVQAVHHHGGRRRCVAGHLLSGRVHPGLPVVIQPSGVSSTVETIEAFDGVQTVSGAPQAITLTLRDDVDVGRGDLLSEAAAAPLICSHLRATLLWLAERPFVPGTICTFRQATGSTASRLIRVVEVLDREHFGPGPPREIAASDIGTVEIRTQRPVAVDVYSQVRSTGGFLLIDPTSAETLACGMVVEELRDQAAAGAVHAESAVTVWLTGLPAAGKSTLARGLQERLRAFGTPSLVLDGDQMRNGLNRDLGFGRADRSENIRRVAEIARLCNRSGMMALVSLISPFAADRDAARTIIGPDAFIEVHVATPIETCRARDEKGNYRRALAGAIAEFTGVSSPYELPDHPNLRLDTTLCSVESCLDRIMLALDRVRANALRGSELR